MRKITISMAIIAMNAGGMYLCADTPDTGAASAYFDEQPHLVEEE